MINLVYERTNKETYDMIQLGLNMIEGTTENLESFISNEIFPTMLNKVGDTITREDLVDRNYNKFKIPVSKFGAITEYLAANMIKASNASPLTTGTKVEDFVINNPDISALYSTNDVRANYGLTINQDKWLDAIDADNYNKLSQMIAISMQSLYDGIDHDHDALIPALFGALYSASKASSKITIPAYSTFSDDAEYSKTIFATLNKYIRDMTTWRRKDFNMMNMEMSDSKNDLVLVSFDNAISDTNNNTILDIITSQLQIGPTARAVALGQSLGIEVYEMPSIGILENSVSRAYSVTSLPGMQTADTSSGTVTKPYANVKFALVGKGALNVALKRLQVDSGRSIRGHFDQTWVQPTLNLSFGAGQAIFFKDGEDVGEDTGEGTEA